MTRPQHPNYHETLSNVSALSAGTTDIMLVEPHNAVKVIKGEIHNVLNVMRADPRYASPMRFVEELPEQHPLLLKLRDLHSDLLEWELSASQPDALVYLPVFCEAISGREISASITGAALSALHKFLLYGFILPNSPQAREGMELIANSLLTCTFEESVDTVPAGEPVAAVAPANGTATALSTPNKPRHRFASSGYSTQPRFMDEQVVLKLLDLTALVVRCSLLSEPLLEPEQVVGLLDTCLHVSHRAKRASPLLKSAAADALSQIVLQVFAGDPQQVPRKAIWTKLASLLNPQEESECSMISLTLVNIALETMKEATLSQDEIAILQNDLCKHLLQWTTTHDLSILSLTLRVIFNLFISIRNHLKVPLEVFLTSVHLRILEAAPEEEKEVALESLLEFCQEPALMQDIYLNYDCDVHCTNLFEAIGNGLAKAAQENSDGNINVLNRLAMEGILAILDSVARRCIVEQDDGTANSTTSFDDLSTRWQSEVSQEELQERKRKKISLFKTSQAFNQDPMGKEWLELADKLGLFSDPTPAQVAHFLFSSPGLDKVEIGLYLSKGPVEEYPFQAQVREEFVKLFDFQDLPFAFALRKFLQKFRLPGEAQCIDRLMEAFSKEMYNQQNDSIFASSDAVYVLSFSTIMLNTDLHNPNLKKSMTVEEFLKNNKGINDGKDLPAEFLTELYEQIRDNEIRVRKELGEFMRRHSNSNEDIRSTWEGILSQQVATAFFTPAQEARKNTQAGVHEKEMFTTIAKSALQSVVGVFARSFDDTLVVKALRGIELIAKISIYFDLDDSLNDVMQALLTHGRDYITGCISLEYSGFESGAPSMSSRDEDEEQAQIVNVEAPIPYAILNCSDPNGDSISRDLQGGESKEDVTGSAAHRGLLALDSAFKLVRTEASRIKGAWPLLIECICGLRDARALPARVSDLDDFADSSGNLLPLSPYAQQSQSRLDEYYRSLSSGEGQKKKTWFRFFRKGRSRELSEDESEIPDESSRNPGKGELSAFSKRLLQVAEPADLEDVVLMTSKRLSVAKLAVRALLDAVDDYQYSDDPMFEQHAAFSLELAVRSLFTNRDRAIDIFPLFVQKFETIIAAATSEETATPFLLERVVVTILRSSIHLYDQQQLRANLRSSLLMLTNLQHSFIRDVADRMACGLAIILRSSFQYFEEPNEWEFMSDTLDLLAHFGPARGLVFDGIASTIEFAVPPVRSDDGQDATEQDEEQPMLSLLACRSLSKILLRFVFGSYQNDTSLSVPAMHCVEKVYKYIVLLLLSENSGKSLEEVQPEEGAALPVPDTQMWQNVVVALYSVCRSTDPEMSRHGTEFLRRFSQSTQIAEVPDEKWSAILYLMANKQPPCGADVSRGNTFSLLGEVMLRVVPSLSQRKDNLEDLEDLVTQVAALAEENLRAGRRGSVSPLFEKTLETVTHLSNHLVTSDVGEPTFCSWASETLLAELEKIGAGGGSIKNVSATTKKESSLEETNTAETHAEEPNEDSETSEEEKRPASDENE